MAEGGRKSSANPRSFFFTVVAPPAPPALVPAPAQPVAAPGAPAAPPVSELVGRVEEEESGVAAPAPAPGAPGVAAPALPGAAAAPALGRKKLWGRPGDEGLCQR